MPKLWDEFRTRGRFARGWLKDCKAPALWITAFLILFAAPYLFTSPDVERVKWQGTFFQWAGVLSVAWGLADTRSRLFHKTPLRKELWGWIRRLSYIVRPPPPITGFLTASLEGSDVLTAHLSVRENVTGTTDERIAALAENLSRVDKTLSELQQAIDSVKHQAVQRIDSERSERLAEERSIRDLLEQATVGGIKLALGGVAFLVVGILFASVPEFVASALQYEGTTGAAPPPPSVFLE
jgi:hypothetical protein